MVPQAVKGNQNRAKAGVATVGRHSLSLPRARRTESRSRGGEVTLRATATAKWPSRLQREVTARAEAAQRQPHQRPAARASEFCYVHGVPDRVPFHLPTPGSGSLMGTSPVGLSTCLTSVVLVH